MSTPWIVHREGEQDREFETFDEVCAYILDHPNAEVRRKYNLDSSEEER